MAEELGLSKIKMLTDKRKRKMDVLLKKYTIEEIRHSIALEKYLKKGDEEGAIEYLGIKDQNKNKIRTYYKRTGNDYLEE